jgi:hypothetical protein
LIYIADSGNKRIAVFDYQGNLVREIEKTISKNRTESLFILARLSSSPTRATRRSTSSISKATTSVNTDARLNLCSDRHHCMCPSRSSLVPERTSM